MFMKIWFVVADRFSKADELFKVVRERYTLLSKNTIYTLIYMHTIRHLSAHSAVFARGAMAAICGNHFVYEQTNLFLVLLCIYSLMLQYFFLVSAFTFRLCVVDKMFFFRLKLNITVLWSDRFSSAIEMVTVALAFV